MGYGYDKAEELAKHWHKGQEYGTGVDYYTGHLVPCEELAQQYAKDFDYWEASRFLKVGREPTYMWGHDILICVLLHDILEDTECGWQRLCYEVGYNNAYTVFCVTDGAGKNRKERKFGVYKKIRNAGTYAPLFVKLIDRLHNVSSPEKLDMYRKEHYTFKCALDDGSFPELWKAIEDKLGWSF